MSSSSICNIYSMMFRSSPWCSSATLQVK
jgi:hypothetical protein